MGMFLNYQNIADNYRPNNLISAFPVGKSCTKLDPMDASKPYEEFNAKGELIGYSWLYGSTVNLEFNIDGSITVDSDAIILVGRGEEPSFSTEAKRINQKAYNVTDLRSWTCTSVIEDCYYWTEDDEFEYNEYSDKTIFVSAEAYLKDKHVQVVLYNFRMEPVYTITYEGTPKIVFTIDAELSKQLVKGIYYCSATVIDEGLNMPIFGTSDCKFLVK